MSHSPEVTIRHAKRAIGLLLIGAETAIRARFGDDDRDRDRAKDAVRQLYDELAEVIVDGAPQGSFPHDLQAMLDAMQAALGESDCPTAIRELLAAHHLEP